VVRGHPQTTTGHQVDERTLKLPFIMQICYLGMKNKINEQIAKYIFLFGYLIICVFFI